MIAMAHGGGAGGVVGKDHAAVDGVVGHVVHFGVDLVIVIARPVIEKLLLIIVNLQSYKVLINLL